MQGNLGPPNRKAARTEPKNRLHNVPKETKTRRKSERERNGEQNGENEDRDLEQDGEREHLKSTEMQLNIHRRKEIRNFLNSNASRKRLCAISPAIAGSARRKMVVKMIKLCECRLFIEAGGTSSSS